MGWGGARTEWDAPRGRASRILAVAGAEKASKNQQPEALPGQSDMVAMEARNSTACN